MKEWSMNSNDSDHYLKDTNKLAKLIAFLDNADCLKGREWTKQAACRGRNDIDWFPAESLFQGRTRAHTIKIRREEAKEALAICDACPVKQRCRQDHRHEQYGVYYGTVPAERSFRSFRDCNCMRCVSSYMTRQIGHVNRDRQGMGDKEKQTG